MQDYDYDYYETVQDISKDNFYPKKNHPTYHVTNHYHGRQFEENPHSRSRDGPMYHKSDHGHLYKSDLTYRNDPYSSYRSDQFHRRSDPPYRSDPFARGDYGDQVDQYQSRSSDSNFWGLSIIDITFG